MPEEVNYRVDSNSRHPLGCKPVLRQAGYPCVLNRSIPTDTGRQRNRSGKYFLAEAADRRDPIW